MTEFKRFQNHNISQWQSNRMRQIIIDRWQETWTVVETRNKRLRRSS
ncbi:hypothetical protein IQ255_28630 [Pleurocapsales cyanobacterium LEGE 10410]|nr:hypothetical protein [Pleurocapsales cyanobacterium LEGE 10410]